MFQFSKEELENWRSQFVISNPAAKMALRRPPYAFSELGVAMPSTVLRSKNVIQINIAIMPTFVRLREILATQQDLARKVKEHDRQIATRFSALEKPLLGVALVKHCGLCEYFAATQPASTTVAVN
jgi:hypothetical protein